MKVLGDQAVADPSKVEQRVMQQVHERQLTHEMKNLAAKLTPGEKREKQIVIRLLHFVKPLLTDSATTHRTVIMS